MTTSQNNQSLPSFPNLTKDEVRRIYRANAHRSDADKHRIAVNVFVLRGRGYSSHEVYPKTVLDDIAWNYHTRGIPTDQDIEDRASDKFFYTSVQMVGGIVLGLFVAFILFGVVQ